MAGIRISHGLLPIFLGGFVCLVACGYRGPLQGTAPSRQLIDDRDRIYDRFGPPDNIEAHPDDIPRPVDEGGGEADTFPYEDWHYSHPDGIGDNVTLEFVDDCQCGDYQLYRLPEGSGISFPVPVEK